MIHKHGALDVGYCIYSNDTIDKNLMNPEHIISLTLGGCDDFTIQVSKTKNSDANRIIDNPNAISSNVIIGGILIGGVRFSANVDNFMSDIETQDELGTTIWIENNKITFMPYGTA